MKYQHIHYDETPDNCSVWRYLDLNKFDLLLENQSLYFPRIDGFEDPYEGELPDQNYMVLKKRIGLSEDEFLNVKEKVLQSMYMKKMTYVSCWHLSEFESDAMWKRYSPSYKVIALKTRVKKLKDIIENRKPEDLIFSSPCELNDPFFGDIRKTIIAPSLGTVDYLDFNGDSLKFPPSFLYEGGKHLLPAVHEIQCHAHPFFIKRKSFDYEKEYRIVFQVMTSDLYDLDKCGAGLSLKINLGELVDEIYIAPKAERNFLELVKSKCNAFCQKYTLKPFNIISSKLYKLNR